MKVYQRTENDTVTQVSVREGLDEINHAQMAGKRDVRTMSSITRTDFAIQYKDGRSVRLVLVDAPCGNRWKYGKDLCAREVDHIGPHRNTKAPEAWTFRWFDNEGTPAEETGGEAAPANETSVRGKRIVTAKGKRYVVSPVTPAVPRTPGAVSWIPEAYVSYWSERNGDEFGATRSASASDKPGTVGRAIWDAVNAG